MFIYFCVFIAFYIFFLLQISVDINEATMFSIWSVTITSRSMGKVESVKRLVSLARLRFCVRHFVNCRYFFDA